MYSQCNGRKKALLIGINYVGTNQALEGCQNDANNMKKFIQKHYNYQDADVVMLTDDRKRRPEEQPNRANILRGMQWLVRNAQPNDSLFFHYSGHGGLTKDLDGDEEDGFDEVIYPMDFEEAGHIVDDEMHDIMVKPLPAGCRLTAIFDSCHSGSALDLPFVYSTEGKIKEPNVLAAAGTGVMGIVKGYASHDYGSMLKGATALFGAASGKQNKAEEFSRRTKSSPADVISWSGCKDSQTSADTQVAGKGTGAMSWAFMESLNRNPQQSYQQLLVSIRALLRDKYSQRPQLSSSHPMDTSILFIA
ncbi:Ca(2+)-dependent cysteine protease [Tulasnella sp. JGI-2019a]|nr:Ca(2+)-dependent cysteine protease [Tulasnella sp. JGI-2019a]